ncbi:MAG: hypothetical protein A3H28_10230 [Acidobacteria bacterium RIFCSPLOWO2_02_FULL_61_28]|nr:MAG: hypothetical protein A3H28_10230 [Acidobacteria bacterium RIFCSPLOWO2_02_FULL_61_28]
MFQTKRFHFSGMVSGAVLFCCALQTGVVWGQAPAASAPVAPTDVVLTVGNVKLTAAEIEQLIRYLPPQFAGAVGALGKRGFADQYANLLGLAQEGQKLKIDQREDFRHMVEFQRTLMLAQTTLNELATAPGAVTADDINAYHASHSSEFEEAKLRGIYIPFDTEPGAAGQAANAGKPKLTEAAARAKAESLRSRIQGGADIAELAKTESEHPSSANGGDFGYVKRNQFAPEIDRAVFALEPKQVSAPLRDRFGFFIFQLEGKRVQPLAEAQPAIENNLRQQKLVELLNRMKTTYPVVMDPRYFPETAPTLPGATPVPPR